jgi:AcrR family transcriptional regulator
MGSSERRERERLELRQKILDAARELFTQRGYEAVTMREIGKRIEYSATALYGHFADKETLFRELCRQDFAAFAQRFLEIAHVADPVERLAWVGLAYLDFARQFPQQFRLMFLTEAPPQPPEGDEAMDPAQNAYVMLFALVDELSRAGKLRKELDDPHLVAQTMWAVVHGVAALELNLPKEEGWLPMLPREERARAGLAVAMNGLLRDPASALPKLEKVLALLRGSRSASEAWKKPSRRSQARGKKGR